MQIKHILFSIGKDKPGIVTTVTEYLMERGANIEDSRMAAMGGRFTLTILYSSSDKAQEQIEQQIEGIQKTGLSCAFYDAETPGQVQLSGRLPLYIDVQAMDQTGIVHKVVNILHKSNANIENLDTKVINAPFSGEALFNLTLLASIPKEQSINQLKKDLYNLAEKNNFDLSFPKK